MGNHELGTVIRPDFADYVATYDSYVTIEAKRFFGTRQIRADAIRPFLDTSPYYMLGFHHEEVNEMACIHAGFHRGPGDDLTADLEEIQVDINDGTQSLSDLPAELLDKFGGPFWNRVYNVQAGFCAHLVSPYPFIIVGHCPTMMANGPTESRTTHITKTKAIYAGCDSEIPRALGDVPNRVGCVVLDCQGAHDVEAPKLAFVDVGMSQGQRWPTIPAHHIVGIPNEDRPVQMLLLTHDPLLEEERYFNRIDRVSSVGHSGFAVAPGVDDTNTLLYQALPKPVEVEGVEGMVGHPGGSRRSRGRKSNTRRTRKRRTTNRRESARTRKGKQY